jgi:purine-binding chemotaxis protein CheW
MTLEAARAVGDGPQRAINALDGYFSIQVAEDVFGLPVTRVQNIFRIGAVTLAPGAPRDIVGLVNLRGRIVTAVSLRRRLGLEAEAGGSGSLAIGVEHGGEAFALLVDEIGDVLSLDPDSAIAAPPHIPRSRAKFAAAYHRIGGRILPLLNIDAVFDFNVTR